MSKEEVEQYIKDAVNIELNKRTETERQRKLNDYHFMVDWKRSQLARGMKMESTGGAFCRLTLSSKTHIA